MHRNDAASLMSSRIRPGICHSIMLAPEGRKFPVLNISSYYTQFTLLKLSRDFKRCDNLNREYGRVKNRGGGFDFDEKFSNLTRDLTHPNIQVDPENPPDSVLVHPIDTTWYKISLILCLVLNVAKTESSNKYVYREYLV